MKHQDNIRVDGAEQMKPKYYPPKMEKHPPVKVVQGTGSSSLYTVVYYWY